MSDIGARLSSRKFLLVVAGIVVTVVEGIADAGVDVEMVWRFVGAFVALEGGADLVSRVRAGDVGPIAGVGVEEPGEDLDSPPSP